MRTRFGLKVAPGIKTTENSTNIPASIRTLYNFKTSKHRTVTCPHRSVKGISSCFHEVFFNFKKLTGYFYVVANVFLFPITFFLLFRWTFMRFLNFPEKLTSCRVPKPPPITDVFFVVGGG